MSYVPTMDQFMGAGIQELTFDEIDDVMGASQWGENVLKYGGAGGFIGGLAGGPAGGAIGFLGGAAIGTLLCLV